MASYELRVLKLYMIWRAMNLGFLNCMWYGELWT